MGLITLHIIHVWPDRGATEVCCCQACAIVLGKATRRPVLVWGWRWITASKLHSQVPGPSECGIQPLPIVYIYIYTLVQCLCGCVCVCVYIYIYMYVCMYVYIHALYVYSCMLYAHIHSHTHRHRPSVCSHLCPIFTCWEFAAFRPHIRM